MTTEPIHNHPSQLDRMDGKLDQVLDRLTRMEEQTIAHNGWLHAHTLKLDDHASRIRSVEIDQAVAAATNRKDGKVLQGRWAAVGTISIVILGAIGAFVGNLIIRLIGPGG